MLTQKQHSLLLLIHRCLKETGVAPSFEEMKNEVGLKSKSGIHRLVSSLEERGFIRRLPHKARALEVLKLPDNFEENSSSSKSSNPFAEQNDKGKIEIPLFGKIAAGTPIEALRNETETVSIPTSMLSTGEHYALTVDGDSMIEAGILDGDMVIIKRTETAENGSIVVALVDGEEVTLKTMQKKEKEINLIPANKDYQIQIYSPERVSVQGQLVGLMRQY
jgi:repressor LexA